MRKNCIWPDMDVDFNNDDFVAPTKKVVGEQAVSKTDTKEKEDTFDSEVILEMDKTKSSGSPPPRPRHKSLTQRRASYIQGENQQKQKTYSPPSRPRQRSLTTRRLSCV